MKADKAIFRIIDANFNRSREGLRVCEDIMRFFVNSRELTKRLKTIRHGISRIISTSPKLAKILIDSRDSGNDVGKKPRSEIEVSRCDAIDIFTANMERAKESIRVLEEFFKIIDEHGSAILSSYRFEAYDIEKKAITALGALRRAK